MLVRLSPVRGRYCNSTLQGSIKHLVHFPATAPKNYGNTCEPSQNNSNQGKRIYDGYFYKKTSTTNEEEHARLFRKMFNADAAPCLSTLETYHQKLLTKIAKRARFRFNRLLVEDSKSFTE